MEYRKFGTTDFEVSPMGLGCMRMSGPNGGVDDRESIATLHMAFDLGINFLDTSASYGNGLDLDEAAADVERSALAAGLLDPELPHAQEGGHGGV